MEPPKPLNWYLSFASASYLVRYPQIQDRDGTKRPAAWAFDVPKRFLKKLERVNQFNKYLIEQNEFGTITRQEEVSPQKATS